MNYCVVILCSLQSMKNVFNVNKKLDAKLFIQMVTAVQARFVSN